MKKTPPMLQDNGSRFPAENVKVMRIGELARQAGVNAQSIRFYERRQLLRAASRTSSGYRVYDEDDLDIVRAIKEMQELGFTLREIKQLMDLHAVTRPGGPQGSGDFQPAILMAQEKLQSIDEKVRLLRKMRGDVLCVLELLKQRAGAEVCPVARGRARVDR